MSADLAVLINDNRERGSSLPSWWRTDPKAPKLSVPAVNDTAA